MPYNALCALLFIMFLLHPLCVLTSNEFMLSWFAIASKITRRPSPVRKFDERFKTTNDLQILTTFIKFMTPSSPIVFLLRFIHAIRSVSTKLPIAPEKIGPSPSSPKLIFLFAHSSFASS